MCGDGWAVQSRVLKVKTKINMYSAYKIPIATIEKGDRVVDRMAFSQPSSGAKIIRVLKDYDEDTFLYLNEEYESDRMIAIAAGYRKLGIKINTFGDIQGVYFKDQPSFLGDRREFKEQNMMLPEEKLVLRKTSIPDVSNICDIIKLKD